MIVNHATAAFKANRRRAAARATTITLPDSVPEVTHQLRTQTPTHFQPPTIAHFCEIVDIAADSYMLYVIW